jgi:inner membrane protein
LILGRAYEARSPGERVVVMAAFGGLALLPDLDIVGASVGMASNDIVYGHRGCSHSLLFAVALSVLVWGIARKWGSRPLFTALLAFAAVASHGVLDSMTYTTRGIAFFWPLTDVRIALPWRPIPPAPMATTEFLGHRGIQVMGVELVYFVPLLLVAFSPTLAWWRRQIHRLAFWRRDQRAAGSAIARPLPAAFTPLRGAMRLVGVVVMVAMTMTIAQVYLRQSRMVAWIEKSTPGTMAVSMAARRPYHNVH